MPFVAGQAKPGGHTLTDADRARGQVKNLAIMDRKREMKLEDLKSKTSNLLGRLTDWLEATDEHGNPRFEQMLADSKIKDIAVVFGILTEKFLLTQGQPTTIMAHQEQRTADELFNAVMQEAKRRGLVKRPIEVVNTQSVPQQ
jgi:hypothetical protein